MKWFVIISVFATFPLIAVEAFACNGYKGLGNFSAFGDKNNFNSFANAGCQSAMNYQYAAAIAAQKTAQRNARLKPIRIANAKRIREKNLLALERRRDERIAQREQREREAAAQQELLAESREWSDITGKYTTRAKLIASDGRAVQLLKNDGSKVVVPLSRLSPADRDWLAARDIPLQPDFLLANK